LHRAAGLKHHKEADIMRSVSPKEIRYGFAILTVIALAAAGPAHGQQSAFTGSSDTAVAPNSSVVGDSAANDIVSRVLAENKRRNERLHNYSVTRTYEIQTPEGKLAAQTVVRMDYRAPDAKTFEKTSEKGSGIVRHLVFDRLMDSESESSTGKEHRDSALTPANYDFRLLGAEDVGPYHCFVLEVIPKRKDKYLFEGKVWIESHDFAVARIEGHPAKKLSFWVNRADFVREYQKVDEFWLPLRDETQVDVKIYGKRVLTIEHGPYVIPDKRELTSGSLN
jgi:hypothetical protein